MGKKIYKKWNKQGHQREPKVSMPAVCYFLNTNIMHSKFGWGLITRHCGRVASHRKRKQKYHSANALSRLLERTVLNVPLALHKYLFVTDKKYLRD